VDDSKLARLAPATAVYITRRGGNELDEADFRQWLQDRRLRPNSINTRVGSVRRVEQQLQALGVPYPDLDAAFDADALASVVEALRRLRNDARAGGTAYRVVLPQSEQPERLTNFISWVQNYRDFRSGAPAQPMADADRIRQYALDNLVIPARDRGEPAVSLAVRDIHDALGLHQQWANVCQALTGEKFRELAELGAPRREGPEVSSTTVFIFDLESALTFQAVEAQFRDRFGAPTNGDNQYVAAFKLADGREIALERQLLQGPPVQAKVWVEADRGLPEDIQHELFEPSRGRQSNLPPRLKHNRPDARQVAAVRVASLAQLRRLLDWYSGQGVEIDRARLEALKRLFLARYPDFEPTGFAATSGGYHEEERAYKDALLERAGAALGDPGLSDDALGARLLDILTGKGGAKSDLLGWRTNDRVTKLRTAHPGVLEEAAGQLARSDDVMAAIVQFVEATWPVLSEGQASRPFAETRNLPTMLAALVRPQDVYAINNDPVWRLGKALLGLELWGATPLTDADYRRVLVLAQDIQKIMRDEWGWRPRDLWDVQGFVWAVHRPDQIATSDAPEESARMSAAAASPTNLILYGPPGTGKTYATAEEAMRICQPASTFESREALMEAYRQLCDSGQIEFVTFHQSYSYEEFVEGLRPEPGEGGASGFRLLPKPGVLRRIARRAETAPGLGGGGVTATGRRIFKMSLGDATDPEDATIFDEAIQGGYALLGFGMIDWSDAKFSDRDEIIRAWRAFDPKLEATPRNARVQCPHIFRNWMGEGDLIVVSRGLTEFRAIGLVTGPYLYAPRDDDRYPHRRSVEWLWVDRAGVPVEEISAKRFSQRTLYLLTDSDLNVAALNRYIGSTGGGRERQQFVLIIDEINRANISKVFGELITLIEPDKRLGQPGEIKLRLPYSNEAFGVPANLHFIGTMNTADRSIALLDTALRRRFQFRELMPRPELLEGRADALGVDLARMLAVLNERIEYLFDREHQIGHAYFIGCQTPSELDEVMRHRVIPLLAEYFYEDWTKVAAVLGDADGEGHFVERQELRAPPGIDLDEGAEPRYRWRLKTAFGERRYEQFR